MISQDSLDALLSTGAERTFCSWHAGWRGVLLRAYKDPQQVDEYLTSPTSDQKIVLVTAGSCEIEGYRGGVWHCANYRPGHIGLVPPGEAARLRWRGAERHHTIQMHVPGEMIASVARDLFGRQHRRSDAFRCLSIIDPVVSTTMLELKHSARSGAPNLHAETAARFLVSHMLLRQGGYDVQPQALLGRDTLKRLDDYMQAGLARQISLAELACVAGVSRFQLLRLAKRVWGETPHRRLTRMRMEFGKRLLLSRRMTIIEVALECGYANSSHFATAFRRVTGHSPSDLHRPS